MSEDPGARPPDEVEPEPTEIATITEEEAIPVRRARGSPPPAIFLGAIFAGLLVFGPAVLVLGGLGRTTAEPEESPTPSLFTARPAATAAGAQRTGGGGNVRVISTSGSSQPMASGTGYQVTFIWVLENAREGDPIKVQFYAASRMLAEREGTLDPQIYTFSTGTLRITTTQECSPSGWQADLVGVRGQVPAGETLANVAGVACR